MFFHYRMNSAFTKYLVGNDFPPPQPADGVLSPLQLQPASDSINKVRSDFNVHLEMYLISISC